MGVVGVQVEVKEVLKGGNIAVLIFQLCLIFKDVLYECIERFSGLLQYQKVKTSSTVMIVITEIIYLYKMLRYGNMIHQQNF